ncbi:SART-1 protein [Phialemonium atrogriseum]|uniref:SART-1 protein n=1 Tax=Phialemonium atrogriseum TaxID=1093897 RepID=A0AAJ0CAG4_9PEZI|nr:SART-1 protein [Phialemonium atrogriseum]KAK1772951.1 SART-1 protein [Phialemonium atrogriseum]
MDAASIEEVNKLRKSMGMKLLPVPGADTSTRDESASPEPDEDAPSTLETREAQAYDNFRKTREAEESKKRREAKAAAVKKAREKAQRSAVLEGKGLGDLDDGADVDAKSWLMSQKKRQKKIAKARKLEEKAAAEAAAAAAAAAEYTAKDIAGIKVGHDMTSFLDGDEQVLTLKDTNVLDEEESEDELENQELREREKLTERLELKKKKPVYDPNDFDDTGERSILAQYDEEISGKKKKLFKLNQLETSTELADILDGPVQKRRFENLDVAELEHAPPSDYLDISEIKVKKPKKKKSKTTRQRPVDEDDVLLPTEGPNGDDAQLMDVDSGAGSFSKKRKTVDESFVDDDDLQASLALHRREALKKRKRTRPEDLARQLREEASQEQGSENGKAGDQPGGIVLDEITGFVDTLQKPGENEERKRRPNPKSEEQAVTAMDQDSSDEDEVMRDAAVVKEESPDREQSTALGMTTTGVEEEESISQGMGAALKLLKDRGLLKDEHGTERNEQFRRKQLFLAELNRRMSQFDEEVKVQRERDRASGRLDRMSVRDREDWQRQQNTMRDQHQSRIMDQLYREGYKPTVELKYFDDYGRSLDQKEAFKHLSHQFHGKGSGKGKTDKRLKKIEDEKRRESQSMLDVSQNVGMSSAAAQQLKKRREAGVRLA